MDVPNNVIYFYFSGHTFAAGSFFQLSAQSSQSIAWNGDHGTFTVQANVPNVPEPASFILLAGGLLGVGTQIRRKLRK
jgi:hypothetical protein